MANKHTKYLTGNRRWIMVGVLVAGIASVAIIAERVDLPAWLSASYLPQGGACYLIDTASPDSGVVTSNCVEVSGDNACLTYGGAQVPYRNLYAHHESCDEERDGVYSQTARIYASPTATSCDGAQPTIEKWCLDRLREDIRQRDLCGYGGSATPVNAHVTWSGEEAIVPVRPGEPGGGRLCAAYCAALFSCAYEEEPLAPSEVEEPPKAPPPAGVPSGSSPAGLPRF